MKDKLLFGTIGLLVGIVVMQWTMPNVQATYVPQGTGIVGVMDDLGPTGGTNLGGTLLDQNGNLWSCRSSTDVNVGDLCWQPAGTFSMPIPLSSIKFCGNYWLLTYDNHFWTRHEQGGVWRDCGPWPGSPLPAEQSTWGKVKAKFSGKGDKQ